MSIKHKPWIITNMDTADVTRKMVLRACRTDGSIYHYFKNDERFNSDYDICKTSVKSCGYMINLMPHEIQQDVTIQMYAVKQSSVVTIYSYEYIKQNYCLKYASEEFKDNFDISYEAVKRNTSMYKYISERLKMERIMIMEVCNGKKIDKSFFSYFNEIFNSEKYNNDFELINKAVSNNGLLLQFLDKNTKFMKCYEYIITLNSVKNDGMALQYASTELCDDYGIVYLAVCNNKFKYNPNYHLYETYDTKVERSKIAINFASEKLQINKIIGTTAVKNNYLSIKFVCDELRNDKNLMTSLVETDFETYLYASDELRKDIELTKLFIKKMDVYLPKCEDVSVFRNNEFILKSEMVDGCADYEINYYREYYSFLKFIDETLCANKEIVKFAVNRLGCDLKYASAELKKDYEIIDIALNNTPFAYKYIDDSYKKNKEIQQRILSAHNGEYLKSYIKQYAVTDEPCVTCFPQNIC